MLLRKYAIKGTLFSHLT